jgi:excisionase family DNA binding protein
MKISDLPRGLLKARDLAKFFNVSEKTIYRWYDVGEIDGIKIGNTLRFTRHDVETLLEARRGRE